MEVFGKIEDVYFDEHTGNILALEIVGKFSPTARSASGQLELADIVSIGPDAVIINMSAIPRLSGQPAGETEPPEPSTQSPDSLPVLNDVTSGMQVESAIPDPTVGSSMPVADDLQTSMMSTTPPTSQLPLDSSGEIGEAADDASDDANRAWGRVSDPTSGGQG